MNQAPTNMAPGARDTMGTTGQSGSINSGAMGAANTTGPVRFLQQQMANQWLASNLMNESVYATDGNSIGDINDLVLDSNGQIAAVIVGVGGFLGIGEKDVAIPFNALEVRRESDMRTGTNATTGAATGTGAVGTGTAGTVAPGTNATGTATTTARTGTVSNDLRIMVRASRAELQNAPAFRDLDDANTTTGTVPQAQPSDAMRTGPGVGSPTGTGTGAAPQR
jgi:sporulation protein YlmC with PRC-barrel domain